MSGLPLSIFHEAAEAAHGIAVCAELTNQMVERAAIFQPLPAESREQWSIWTGFGKLAGTVWARDEVDALDTYAVATGFVPYSELERECPGVLVRDEYGNLFGIYTNYSIYAERMVP